ncbi:hypothetical protein RI367_002067 [Sorochytrium milnesiophthora]
MTSDLYANAVPDQALIVFAQGLSREPQQHNHTYLSAAKTPVLDRLCAEGCTGLLWLEESVQQSGLTEFLQLLAIHDCQEDEIDRYPTLRLATVTTSAQHHVLCKRLQIASHLVVDAGKRASTGSVVQTVESCFASAAGANIVMVHLHNDQGVDGESVEALLQAFSDRPKLFRVFISSWNEFQLAEGTASDIRSWYALQDAEKPQASFEFAVPQQSKNVKEGAHVATTLIPMSVVYHHTGSVRIDEVREFNEAQIYARSGNHGIGAWHFMKEIGFKVGGLPKPLDYSKLLSNHQRQYKTHTMSGIIRAFLDWVRSLFWKQEMELTLVGLQASGKSTLVNVIANGQFTEDTIPTVGFNMRKVTKGNVTMKLWDIGGQPRFRSMWERYCRNVNAIVFVVDSADPSKFEAAKAELQNLLARPQLTDIPVLVLGNKNDLPGALSVEGVIEALDLKAINNREIACYSISAKNQVNIDITMQWLIKHASSGKKS